MIYLLQMYFMIMTFLNFSTRLDTTHVWPSVFLTELLLDLEEEDRARAYLSTITTGFTCFYLAVPPTTNTVADLFTTIVASP